MGSGDIATPFLTFARNGGEWSALPPGKAHGTHWLGGWMGPQSQLGLCAEEKDLAPAGNRILAIQPVAMPT
jgi:hypothetical protein